VAPSIATNTTAMVLKPSEEDAAPSALYFAELLYESGPARREMLQGGDGPIRSEIADELITNEHVEPGHPSPVAWRWASRLPRKRAIAAWCWSLAANDPLIVMEDGRTWTRAANLARAGLVTRTAARDARPLKAHPGPRKGVHKAIRGPCLVAAHGSLGRMAIPWRPFEMGTVIDEGAAKLFEVAGVNEAIAQGAKLPSPAIAARGAPLLSHGDRPRSFPRLTVVKEETFGAGLAR